MAASGESLSSFGGGSFKQPQQYLYDTGKEDPHNKSDEKKRKCQSPSSLSSAIDNFDNDGFNDANCLRGCYCSFQQQPQPQPQQQQQRIQRKRKQKPSPSEPSPDELLARELNKLPFQERNTINEEVHGVFDDTNSIYPNETQELIDKSLIGLQKEIDSIPTGNKHAYDLAQRLYRDTTFINTSDFRLIFLRCELFDVKRAAKRLISYLNLCYEVSTSTKGSDKTKSTSVLEHGVFRLNEDFDDQSMEFMNSGHFQIPPDRDRTGRWICGNFSSDIIVVDNNDNDDWNQEDKRLTIINFRIKSVLLMMMRLAMEATVDDFRRGVVGLFWTHNINNISTNHTKIRKTVLSKSLPAIPIRFTATHLCLPPASFTNNNYNGENGGGCTGCITNYNSFLSQFMQQTAINTVQLALKSVSILAYGQQIRPRLRVHNGSIVECLYKLQSFGIHPVQVPIDPETGKIKLTNHYNYIGQLLEKERIKEEDDQIRRNKKESSMMNANRTEITTTMNKNVNNHHNHHHHGKQTQKHNQQIAEPKKKKMNPGTANGDNHNTLLQSKEKPSFSIDFPRQNDILFGRGWNIQNRQGNSLFRNVIERHLEEYNNLKSKKEKTILSASVVKELKEFYQCRFLVKNSTASELQQTSNDQSWMEVSDKVARQKVSVGFRDVRRAAMKSKKQIR